jgi:hypothetical protein
VAGVDLESSFLKLMDEGRKQREALIEAVDLVRRFQIGDPAVWIDAARAMPRLEEVEAQARNPEK